MPKKQTEWTRAYNEKSYDRIGITVPKGQRATIQAHADSLGESVNAMVQRLILADMGRTEWPENKV